jgi:hypothetical protein
MVPFEAFLAEKPVARPPTRGPLEVVRDRSTASSSSRRRRIAEGLHRLAQHVDAARDWGQAGKLKAERISWDHAIERLLA